MKKLVAVSVLIGWVISVTGCDDNGTDQETDASDGAQSDATQKPDVNLLDATSGQDGPEGHMGVGCFPKCVQELFSNCWPEGPTCSLGFRALRRLECFTNGVKIDADFEVGGIVTTPDGGSRCYTLEIGDSRATAGAVEWLYFKGVPGQNQLIATARFPSRDAKVGTIACESGSGMATAPVPLDLSSPSCRLSRNGFGGEFVVPCERNNMCEVPALSVFRPESRQHVTAAPIDK